ncbi:hypothetical protein [Streptomyces sp. NPDC055709]
MTTPTWDDLPTAVRARLENDLAPTGPAPALVWSKRHGWATSRRHPLGRGAARPSPDDGVRHLATGATPTPADLIHALDNTG